MADTNIKFYDSTGAAITVLAKDIGGGLYSLSVREADLSAALGAAADASASSDSGTSSLISLIKRLLAKFTTQFPATLGQKSMANAFPVSIANDQSAVPVSASSLPLPTGAATESTLSGASAKLPATLGQKAMSASLAVTVASDQTALPILLQAGTARQLSATTSSANTALTTSIKAISVRARSADIRIAIGSSSQTANATTSIFIAQNERVDLAVPATANIAVIRDTAATANGILELTELS